jgi:tRNA(Ile)-lysidine synthetase-like protein
VRRDDGVVRPLLVVWREETEAYCLAEGLPFRRDSSNAATKRGLIRGEILPLLRRLHPAADRNLLAALEPPATLPVPVQRALADLLSSTEGSKRVDLGGGRVAVREYEQIWLERSPVRLEGRVEWGAWTIESRVPGLRVRTWRAGDRLARKEKVQDLFVDAKIPRSERDAWPLVVRGDDVVVVPGVAAAPGYEEAVVATRSG